MIDVDFVSSSIDFAISSLESREHMTFTYDQRYIIEKCLDPSVTMLCKPMARVSGKTTLISTLIRRIPNVHVAVGNRGLERIYILLGIDRSRIHSIGDLVTSSRNDIDILFFDDLHPDEIPTWFMKGKKEIYLYSPEDKDRTSDKEYYILNNNKCKIYKDEGWDNESN